MRRTSLIMRSALCVLAMVVTLGVLADSGLARHKKLYVVPVPGKVVIDGKLNDWDLSGQIFMYVISETSDMQSARFALMYDNQALYLSGVVRDPSPMMNRHDPTVDPDKGWDADACQFRMVLDRDQGYPVNQSSANRDKNDQMVHMTLWQYTDRQEPVLQQFYGFDFTNPKTPYPVPGVVTRPNFQAAYVKAADGRSYTFEYRVPWTTLEAKRPPRAGDMVTGTVQFNWGAPDGLKTPGNSAWAYDIMSGPGFAFQTSACWGKIIFAERGKLPKELIEEGLAPERPLPLTFSYALPEDSEATVALFNAEGHAVRTLVASGTRRAGENVERWDGLSDDGKPLLPGTYTWKGLYHQPIKTKFVLSAHNSGQPPYKLDDKTGGWGGDHGNCTSVAAAADGMILTWNMSESGWGIIKTSFDGKKIWGTTNNALDIACDATHIFVVGDYGHNGWESVKVFDLKDGRSLNWGNGKPQLDPPAGGDEKTNISSAVAYGQGKVYVSWTARNLVGVYDAVSGNLQETFEVPKPGDLAVYPDGTVAVVSAGKVLLIRNGKATSFITEHLDDPRSVAVDAVGIIYVANGGALQNIAVFGTDGKYVQSIGKVGGRPRVGHYDPNGILEPGGIAVDPNGRLWVAETLDSPKRHSVWNTKTQQLHAEYFGGSSYFGWAYMDPKHPDELYCHNVLWKVDLNTGACLPYSTIWRPTASNMINEVNPGGYAGHFRVMTAKNGKQFGWGMVDYGNMLYMRDGDIFKPIAGTIRIMTTGEYGSPVLYPVMKELAEGAYMWQDANNDQAVQLNEISISPAGRGESAFNWIDQDLTAWCDAGYKYKPVRFAEDGRPVYDFTQREQIPFTGTNSNGTSFTIDDADGAVYSLAPGADPGFARWTKDGKLVWGYGGVVLWNQALSLPAITPGKLYGLSMPLGTAGDYTGAASYFGPCHLFTRDGIYVAMIMRDGRTGGLGADLLASEVITGQLVKPDGMNRYFLLAGDQDGRVNEILGLDTVKRLPGGTYTYTEQDAKTAADALAEYQRALDRGKRLDIVRGGRNSLAGAKGVSKQIDDKRAFTARVTYDDKNLYVAYDVASEAKLVNGITDPNILFKGGNCLDIQLATDLSADAKRTTPAPGDVRILVTRQAGKPFAVIYRPKVKNFTGKPTVLTSGTGKESFDVIESTNRIGLEYAETTGGFTAVVTIPFGLLGWLPKPGDVVRLDLGYLFGNATGSQISQRAYWMNNSFSANVTYDIPNESRLEPKEWGMATVE